MNFSKMLATTAIVLVASLVMTTEAGGPYCRGHRCHPAPPAYLPAGPVPQYRAPHGPYHSYAVRPAVYGGPRLYTYHGYARHPLPAAPAPAPLPAPVAVHLKAAAYSPYSHAPLVAPLTLAIETSPHSDRGYAPLSGHGYGLHPVKAVLLAPIAEAPLRSAYPKRPYRHNSEPASPAYDVHAALAGPLYRGEALRPAAYGAGHYYQALETLKAQGGAYKAHKSAGPSAGGY